MLDFLLFLVKLSFQVVKLSWPSLVSICLHGHRSMTLALHCTALFGTLHNMGPRHKMISLTLDLFKQAQSFCFRHCLVRACLSSVIDPTWWRPPDGLQELQDGRPSPSSRKACQPCLAMSTAPAGFGKARPGKAPSQGETELPVKLISVQIQSWPIAVRQTRAFA